MKNYVDYITEITCKLLAIDSPTGYTKQAAEFVMEEYRKLGYEPKMTVRVVFLLISAAKTPKTELFLRRIPILSAQWFPK